MASKFVQGNWLLPNNINANKQSNYSFYFDGSSYIDIPITSNLQITNNFSYSFWVKTSGGAGSNSEGTFISNQFSWQTSGYTIGTYSGKIQIFGSDGSSVHYNPSTMRGIGDNNITDNQWHHIAVTFASGVTKVYIDGSLPTNGSGEFTSGATSISYNNTTIFRIGQAATGGNYGHIGQIDEVNIFTRVLSSSEVSSLYNSDTPGNPFDLSGDPIAYYKLGETAIGQAPGGTWDWQVPNHAQSQFAMQATSSGSAGRQICIPPIVLGNTHTFSIWIKGTSSIGQFLFRGTLGQWFSEYSGSDNTAIAIRATGGSNAGRNFASNSINYIANNKIVSATITPLNDNNWHNIIVVRTPTAVKVYIDGGSAVNLTGDTLTSSDILKVKFLTASYGNSGQWTGLVSNAALWTSDRSSEVANIYNNGEPQAVYTTTPQYWWKLDNSATLDNIPVSTGNGILRFKNFGSTYSNTYGSRLLVSTGPFNGNAASGAGLKYSFSSNLNLGTQSTMSWWLSCLNMQRNAYGAQRYFSNGSQIVVSLHPRDQNDYIDINVYAESNSASLIRWTRSANTALYDSITDGQLHCWLITRNAGSVSLYFDNNLIGTSSGIDASNNIIISNIGGNTGTSNQFNPIGNKFWDQFAFFNKELTTAERTDLYNSGVPKDISSLSPSYFMSAGEIDFTNSKFIDLSGNNLTLTFPHATDSSKYLQYKDGASVGNTMNGNLSLQSTELGLHNPLYSQFSNSFDVGTYIDTNFAIPNWTKYAYSIWFKFNGSTISGYDHLIGNFSGNANADGRAIIGFRGTNLYLSMGDGTNSWYSDNQSAAPLLDGSWHHIVLNVYETGQDVYVDGSLLRSYSYSTPPTSNPTTGVAATSNNFINKSGTNLSNNGVDCSVDEHAVFNRLLTTAEIVSIYNNGKPNDISALSPSYWWRLGDSSYNNSSNYYVFPNQITNAPNGVGSATYKPSISANAPKVVAPGVSSGFVELDKKGDTPNSTSNAISYNILKTDQSVYTPGYVSQYTVDNNYSMAFDGNDYFSLGSSVDLGKNHTISFWLYYPANGIHIVTGDPGLGNDYGVFLNNGNSIYYRTTVGYSVFTPTPTLNAWTHLAFTKKDSDTYAKMYLNGVEGSIVGASSSSMLNGIGKFNTIGAKPDGSYGLVGKLDEFAAWDKELTADQIKFDIYGASATANKSADFINNPNLPTPVVWYRMGD